MTTKKIKEIVNVMTVKFNDQINFCLSILKELQKGNTET